MKKHVSLVLFMLAVVVFLIIISGKRPTAIPVDDLHAKTLDGAACTQCHGPTGSSPLAEKHPPKEQCLACHLTENDCHPCPDGHH